MFSLSDAYLSITFWLEVVGYLLACAVIVGGFFFGAALLTGAI